MLKVEGLTSHYARVQALKGVDIEVGAGELVALVGGNGAGKTTLLRTLSGVHPASGGTIRFEDNDITRQASHKRVRLGIAQVPEGRQVFGQLSVQDNLRLGAYLRRDDEIQDDLDRMYRMFDILSRKRYLPAGTLSGGQQQMLALCRALMARPRLLLLDEPSMGLAPVLVDQILDAVATLKKQGMTILLVEQNAYAALSIADRGYVLETGRVALSGPASHLLNDEQVKKAYLGI